MGEMAEMLLGGSRVSSDKLQKSGMQFQYGDLRKAIVNLENK